MQVQNHTSVECIRRAVEESKRQLGSVNHVLVGFKSGLDRLEGQMMPIYNLTEKLRATQKNIDLTVHELRAVNETFNTANEVATTLIQGAKYDQNQYIRSMNKLLKSIAFLESHRGYEGSTKALEQARQLLSQGQLRCKMDIVNDIAVFARYSLDSKGEEMNANVKVSTPTENDVAKVNELVQCLLNSGFQPRPLLIEYGEKRLKLIRDFFRDSKYSKNTHAVESRVEIGQYLNNIIDVIRAEKALSSRIFPNEDLNHAALSYTIAPLLENLTNDVKGESSLKDDVFKPLDLHYLFKNKSAAFKETLQPPLRLREHPGVETTDPWKLVGIIGKIQEGLATTSLHKLNRFKEDINESLQSDKHGLRDGNVHPVSSNVMHFLRQVSDHIMELECLLAADQTTNVSYFIDSILTKLIDSLQAKANGFKGREDLRALFVTNNVFYIVHAIKQLGIDLESTSPGISAALRQTIQPKIANIGEKSMEIFLQLSFDSFDGILTDPTSKLQYNRNSEILTLESGRLVKEKFTKFNTMWEEIYLNHKYFIVPEMELRQRYLQTARERILSSYTNFYEKYSIIQFSKKNMLKYLKYKPNDINQMIYELYYGNDTTKV